MIKIDYFGRYGNNLFQYFCGLILASKLDMPICSTPPKGFLNIDVTPYPEPENHRYCQVNDLNCKLDFTELAKEYDGFHLHGYFQNAELYNPHRDRIKEFLEANNSSKNYDDIVIHLRLTDYWWIKNLSVISPCWYLGLLRREKYRKCYIVVEPHKTNYHYLKYFSHLKNIEIVSGNPAEDFEFIRGFDRIICSNSTFCWWAAFLSDASKIYTFKPWMNNKGIELANMAGATVVDGSFIRNRNLENLDWSEYWKK